MVLSSSVGACNLRSLLAALGLYFGSLVVLRYNLSDMFMVGRKDLWVGYLALIVTGMLIAEILRRFRNPIPNRWRMPVIAVLALSSLVAYQYSPDLLRRTGLISPIAAVATTDGEAVLRSGWDGHYRTIAQFNGAEISLLVDTGASLVLLRHEDAVAAGVNPALLNFKLPVTTAGAQAFVAPIILDAMSIGGVTVHNVRAAVATPGMLHTSLLGMSFLEKLSETTIRGDRMILRQ